MRPFRSRIVTALAAALLLLGLAESVARANNVLFMFTPDGFPEDPPPSLTQ